MKLLVMATLQLVLIVEVEMDEKAVLAASHGFSSSVGMDCYSRYYGMFRLRLRVFI